MPEQAWQRTILVILLPLLILFLMLQPFQLPLRYERELILTGDFWRIWTGHFVHTNLVHLGLNAGGFLLFVVLCPAILTLKQLVLQIGLLATGISLLLLWHHPEIHWYVGFSGILYGLFFAGGIRLALTGEWLVGLGLSALVAGKTGYDLWHQQSASELLIGAPVILEAHYYGIGLAAMFSIPSLYHFIKHKSHATTQSE